MLNGASRADNLLRTSVGFLSFSVYALTAAPGAFWLDSGELAAAGITLGVAHPPGHPLYVFLAYIASWIPLGTAGFRVSLLSGVLGAFSACLTYDLVLMLTRGARDGDPSAQRWDRVAAALSAIVLAVSAGVWLQAVRAEVYTLQLALHLWITREVLRWHMNAELRTNAHLWRAALGVGLAMANHHLLMVAHIPALLVLFLGVPEERRAAPRLAGQGALWGAWALGIYAMLPVRAATSPLMNYGDPSTLERLADVVTARVFQSSVTATSPSVMENLNGAMDMFLTSLGPLILCLALVGFGWLARRHPIIAGALVLGLACNLATKVSMVLDPTNPDAAGYFQTGLAMVAVGGGLGLRATLDAIKRPSAQFLLTALIAMTSGAQAWAALDRLDISEHRSPMATDMLLVSSAAPNSLWLTSFYGLHFNRLYHVAVDGFRPDVTCIHQGFEGHVNGGRSLGEAHRRAGNHVESLTDAFELTGAFPVRELEETARERGVYLEPTLGLPVASERLDYGGGYAQVLGAPSSLAEADARHRRDTEALLSLLGQELRAQRETRVTLMMMLIQRAVVALKRGAVSEARRDLESVSAVSPQEPSVARLLPIVAALESAGDRREQVLARIRATDFADLFSRP